MGREVDLESPICDMKHLRSFPFSNGEPLKVL